MAMKTEQIIELMEGELKRAEERLAHFNEQKELDRLRHQTEGQYIILKQLLEAIK